MKPPADLPSLLVALADHFARRAGIDPGDLWAYIYRRKAPPPELRAAIVEEFFPLVSPSDFLGLTSRTENATNATMATSEIAPARIGRPMGRPDHPLVAAMIERGVTLVDVAAEVKRSRASVQSWMLPKDHPNWRPIPDAAKKILRDKYGVPLSTWK